VLQLAGADHFLNVGGEVIQDAGGLAVGVYFENIFVFEFEQVGHPLEERGYFLVFHKPSSPGAGAGPLYGRFSCAV
jgi:hypothetical protein